MAIPDIFSDDPPTERLASYFEELYEYLVDQGVPEECLPSPWHVLRRVTKAIDHELLREWLDAYADVEAEIEDDDDGEEPFEDPRPRVSGRRSRPSYLRALDATGSEGTPDQDADPVSDDDESAPRES